MNPDDDRVLIRALLMAFGAFCVVVIGVVAMTFAVGPDPHPSPTGTTVTP